MVISAGMTSPAWAAVRSLNSFTNAMMLMPCWPSAGPMGGAGVALPAGACTLTIALTFFAIVSDYPGTPERDCFWGGAPGPVQPRSTDQGAGPQQRGTAAPCAAPSVALRAQAFSTW